ncbi:MAG TPA: DUF932 domain-containing protein [Longimicrobium sp.]|nr:DUF932 domain-containing protein [Longimicrobium sp.]
MAHELTFNNGGAEMFSVRQTPWHREGHVLTAAPTYAEALRLAGLDFEVEMRPAYARKTTDDGDEYFVPSDTARLVIRTDNEKELGSVGNWYTPLQNADAFRVLVPLLDAGILELETGGSLRDGADVWLLAKFNLDRFGPVVREVFADEVVPFGLIANNHNGRRGVLLQLTPIRVVCANTLGMAEAGARNGRAITVRHTQGVEAGVVAAAETLFKGIVERYEVVAAQYRTLKAVALEEAEFRRMVLDVIAPHPLENPRFNPDGMMARSVVERAERKRTELTRLWTAGDGHTGDHSAWEAYNAATQALDHNADLWPTRGGVWRTASLLDGQLGTMKMEVLNGLVSHTAARLEAPHPRRRAAAA